MCMKGGLCARKEEPMWMKGGAYVHEKRSLCA